MDDESDEVNLSVSYSVYLPPILTQQQLHDLNQPLLGGVEDFYESVYREHQT